MATENTISILILAKDEASKVIAGAANTTKAASAEVNNFGNESNKSGGILRSALLPAMIAIGAGVGIIAEATHKAADFQVQLTKLVTSAGESQANLALVSSGIKALALQTGASVTDLANAMYVIESGGQHGANGLEVLKAAEQGAKAEGSDLKTVADAVTSVLVDYHLKAGDAATVTSKLVAATSQGKTTFQELAAAMPAILPVASAAHVALSDILGDLASMTVHGMSAEQSAQNLADAIRHMQNPTAMQAKELALLGLTTTQLAEDMKNKGLSGTLQEISTRITNLMPPGSDKVILNLKSALNGLSPAVKELGTHLFDGTMTMKEYTQAALNLDPISAKQAASFGTLAGSMHRIGDQQMTGAQAVQNYGQALAKATGDATGLNVALMLTGENAGTTNHAIAAVNAATAEAGNNVKGWSEIQGNFNTQFDRFKQLIDVGLISLGQNFLPVLTEAVRGFDDFGMQLMGAQNKLNPVVTIIEHSLGPVFANLWKVLDQQLIPALVRFWQQVIVPLIPILGTVLLGALMAVLTVFTGLLQIITPLINFMASNPPVIYALAGAFIFLKAAMMFDQVFNAITIGFNMMKLVTIPSAIASFEGFAALAATPIVMPAIAIGAALLAIATVWGKYNDMMNAINQAQASAINMGNSIDKQLKAYNDIIHNPKSTPAQIAAAKKGIASVNADNIAAVRAEGHALGTNFAPGGLTWVGERGPELVSMPTGSKVYSNDQSQKMVAGQSSQAPMTLNVYVGNYMGSPADRSGLAQSIYQELMVIARQHGAADALPSIGIRPI